MPEPLFMLDTLLDGACILEFAPERLLVLVCDGFSIEIQESPGLLTLRQRTLSPRNNGSLGVRGLDLARIPTRSSLWTDSAEATLAGVQALVRAHARMILMLPPLLVDDVLGHPDCPPMRRNTAMFLSEDSPDGFRSVPRIGLDIGTGRVKLSVRDRLLLRACPRLLRITHCVWNHDARDARARAEEVLLDIPEPPSTAHARMEHQALLAAYWHELEHDILPVIGA